MVKSCILRRLKYILTIFTRVTSLKTNSKFNIIIMQTEKLKLKKKMWIKFINMERFLFVNLGNFTVNYH